MALPYEAAEGGNGVRLGKGYSQKEGFSIWFEVQEQMRGNRETIPILRGLSRQGGPTWAGGGLDEFISFYHSVIE